MRDPIPESLAQVRKIGTVCVLQKEAPMTPRFTIQRLLQTPRSLVWDVCTQAQHLTNWFGPKGCRVTHNVLDLRVGGSYLHCIELPDGLQMWGKWSFHAITAPERIVHVQNFSDPDGGMSRHPMNPEWPAYMLATTTLEERGAQTLFTLEWAPYQATEQECAVFEAGQESMRKGWGGNLDVLESYLAQIQGGA